MQEDTFAIIQFKKVYFSISSNPLSRKSLSQWLVFLISISGFIVGNIILSQALINAVSAYDIYILGSCFIGFIIFFNKFLSLFCKLFPLFGSFFYFFIYFYWFLAYILYMLLVC